MAGPSLHRSRAADVHPFAAPFVLLFFGGLFGFLAVLLAVPLVLLVWSLVRVPWVERAIRTGGDPVRPVVGT